MSDTGKLALALSKAQGAIKTAKKDSNNPFFKSTYADLASVWEACRQELSENELAVIQAPLMCDGILGIKTKLMHSSGEFEESFLPIAAPITAKAQDMGSAITYARRYSLAAMVGVAPDDDDDGNQAQTTGGQAKPKTNGQPKQSEAVTDYIAALIDIGKIDKAENFVGKPSNQWTDADVEKMKSAKKQKKAPEAPQAPPLDDRQSTNGNGRAISDDQIDAIENLCKAKDISVLDALVAEGHKCELIELTQDQAAAMIAAIASL